MDGFSLFFAKKSESVDKNSFTFLFFLNFTGTQINIMLFYYIEMEIQYLLFAEDINVQKPLLCAGTKNLMVQKNL